MRHHAILIFLKAAFDCYNLEVLCAKHPANSIVIFPEMLRIISKVYLRHFYCVISNRTYHFQHIRSRWLNCSPEDIVLVNDLSLYRCVFWAKFCTHTHTDMHTHLKSMCKYQITHIIKNDIFSGGLISTIWLTQIPWFNYTAITSHNKRSYKDDYAKSHNLIGKFVGIVCELMLLNKILLWSKTCLVQLTFCLPSCGHHDT